MLTQNIKKLCGLTLTQYVMNKLIPSFLLSVLSLSLYVTEAKSSDKNDFVSFVTDSNFKSEHIPPADTRYVLNGEKIDISTDDYKDAKAYFVKSKTGSEKYLVLFHEWWGLNDHIKHTADGFGDSLPDVNILAIDLYDGFVTDKPDKASQIMSSTSEERVKKIIKGVFKFCSDDAKICTIGWCYGGGWSLQAALDQPELVKACVMYYGMPEQDTTRLVRLNAPLLGIFARQDKWITPEIVGAFEHQLRALGKKVHVKMYDSKHAFANPSNPNYEKRSAYDASQIVLRFIRANLDVM